MLDKQEQKFTVGFEMRIHVGHEDEVGIPKSVVKKGSKSIKTWLKDNYLDDTLDYGERESKVIFYVYLNGRPFDMDKMEDNS